MKCRRIEVYILSLLLLMTVVYCGIQQSEERVPLAFLAATDHGTEWIYPIIREDGTYQVFVPSYVSMDNLKIQTSGEIRLDGQVFSGGMTLEALEPGQNYTLTGMEDGTNIVFYQSANVPTMYINTESGTMDYINAVKGNEEPGEIQLYTADGKVNYRGGVSSIKGRGQSTFESSAEKKPYSLKLREAANLLDMGMARKWVLLANWYDSSNLRNKLVFDYAGAVGLAYSPQSQWVDLYLNGRYMGLYLLSEKNEIASNRVEISPNDGFLISQDILHRFIDQENPYFVTDRGVPLRVHACTMQEEKMIDLVWTAEAAIFAEDGRDPGSGKHWTELIDLDSWAGKYMVEEIFGGPDAGSCSQYYYYEGNGITGKIFAGPVWDYDLSMAGETAARFYAHVENKAHWFYELYNKQEFKDRIKQLYQEIYQPVLQDLIEYWIPDYMNSIQQAAKLNSIRWWGSPEEDVQQIQNYMRDRMNFLTDIWINEKPHAEITVVKPERYDDRTIYVLIDGASLQDIPELQSYDWYYPDMETPFDKTRPVYEDAMIYGVDPNESKKE